MRAVLSVGANLDDAARAVDGVLGYFRPETVAVSPVYDTAPWGVTDQPDFANAVVVIDTRDSPEELLGRCQALEDAAGRVREMRWGPRTLDVDIVQCTDADGSEIRRATERLTLPHPHSHERAFVLVPWLAADPDARLSGVPVSDLVDGLPPEDVAGVRLPGEEQP
ncbi:2-amino-4-hydroxy-6-hydroxymethyldihydropteridine diphosphokinase [Corynebacterium pygosceleis]|uniref:2-amino-4-hydroxy-6-hydroxymethyldihydropteridine diphosphokinase n=1 Tax=Corynebacterium pygosceleis TaxID=2800406 RepID=A0A9Q4CA36_9CORY|nr:2-amino-4-hydroxy-6-hydroxymethyldihydropteridine diphosphokinase [Corynebacterium pygosceleis]MCK7638417.1 2-amino-4-hydroxy-6-hydroxymethyldihydropteridine diphosphokinase [Corynebacterium pygosceleis]MCK7675397.1 2-amino-4-hydroxy-6-hydroxymethyldihydropteridine diphosphokinase [Corynebacterium pygosceleis]MCL0121209.1 2-amino-4-hydroxy-6-hydroxymethyldihydropteridine diphosphokinase [Corynebacterium pygosceleis]MCX7445423.1 2-amino-4-hydroxy-6-hydroxymethyldihydropteridine diphosphokinas